MIEAKLTRRNLLVASVGLSMLVETRASVSSADTDLYIPNKAIGVNCFDLFYGPLLGQSTARDPSFRMRELRLAGIPFVRFAASPFWPIDWKIYFADEKRYFSILDSIIDAAEANRIGLVPSLFWNPVSISDLVGKPISDWGRDGSKTRAFVSEYVEKFVNRYRKSKAIWMWEFGNEFNTYVDLNNALKWFPKINIAKGTPSARGVRDLLTSNACASAFSHFSKEVVKFDQTHLITTGADIPRPNAFNLAHGKYAVDSRSEFRTILGDMTPEKNSVISLHLYKKAEHTYFKDDASKFSDILQELVAAGKQYGKFTFVGEFGIQSQLDKVAERADFGILLNSIVDSGVNWSALWVYDLAQQQTDWNVQVTGGRSYQLEMVSAANIAVRK